MTRPLTTEQIDEIRRLKQDGVKYQEIQEQLGVSNHTVYCYSHYESPYNYHKELVTRSPATAIYHLNTRCGFGHTKQRKFEDTMLMIKSNKLDMILSKEEDLDSLLFEEDNQIEKNKMRESLYGALDELEKMRDGNRMRQIINSRFFQNKTLEQIGGELDLTRERIRQIETRALRKLKIILTGQYLTN